MKTLGFREIAFMSFPFALAGSALMKAGPATAAWWSGFFLMTSLTVNIAKDLNAYFIKKIDARGDFLGCNLIKGVALVISASLPIFVGSFGILSLYMISGVSLPVISLIALGYLALQLSAGALLKVIAYNTNPKVKLAYDNYLNRTKNQALTKLQNNENLRFFNDLNPDVFELILFSYLSIQDLIQFQSVNKNSNRTICIHRIQESFSTDFINKLGIEHILKAMENKPLDPLLVPISEDLKILHVFTGIFLFLYINNRRGSVLGFQSHMEKNPIAWGHETSQTPKIKSKLFLIFNDVNQHQQTLYGDFDKYCMITSHPNSKIAWEQRSIKKISMEYNESLMRATPIYKVDEDHHSTVPISELKDEDYNDDTIVRKTDFFKHFKTPETLVQI